jgi:hypothetical protein
LSRKLTVIAVRRHGYDLKAVNVDGLAGASDRRFAEAHDLRYTPLSGWQGDVHAPPTVVV